MTNLEIIDKVTEHLLKQNQQAINSIGLCVYRTNDGLKCAVGCLIPIDKYTPEIENAVPCVPTPDSPFNDFLLYRILHNIGITDEQMPILRKLQIIHDDESPLSWEHDLKDLRREYE